MPATRLLAALSLAILLALAVAGPGHHPWFTTESLWLAALFGLVLWGMALMDSFFLDIIVILFLAYFVQRIILIYFRPDALDYQGHLMYSSATFTTAMLFLNASLMAVWLGYGLARVRVRPGPPRQPVQLDSVRIFKRTVPFDSLFRCYCGFAIPLLILQLGLFATEGVGVTSLLFDPKWATIYRISFLSDSLSFLAFVALFKEGSTAACKRFAVSLILLHLALAVAHASKGALLTMLMSFAVCFRLSGRRIPSSFAWVGGGVLVFTALLYAPFMNQVRPAVAEIFKTSVPFLDNLRSAQPIDPAKGLQDFSLRLEGFDWLVGLMTVGREAFPPWISLRGEMVVLLNSLVPGDIIDASEWVPLGALMPVLLKGYALKSLEAHRVVAGIAGIAYLYSGYILGPLFFFVWSFLSVRVLASRLTVFVKMLYFRLFVVDMVTGGHLSNTVMRFYEGMLCLVAAYFVYRWLHRVSPRCRIAAPQWPPGRREGREPGLGMT